MPVPRKTARGPSDIRISGSAPFRTARERKEALSLIRRLGVSAGVAGANAELPAITLEPLTGGRSAALVFKLTPSFGPGRRSNGSPVVVKITPRAQGVHEKANYDRFVRWALPAACRPDLLGFDRTRAYSGLC